MPQDDQTECPELHDVVEALRYFMGRLLDLKPGEATSCEMFGNRGFDAAPRIAEYFRACGNEVTWDRIDQRVVRSGPAAERPGVRITIRKPE